MPYSASLNFLNPLLPSERSTKVRPLGLLARLPLRDRLLDVALFLVVHLNISVFLRKELVEPASKNFLQRGRHAAREVATIPRPGSMTLQRPVCTAVLKNSVSVVRFARLATRTKAQMELTDPTQSRKPAVNFIARGIFADHNTTTGSKAKMKSVAASSPPSA